jgi:hypothetical protein
VITWEGLRGAMRVLRIVGVPTMTRTGDFPDMILKCYCVSQSGRSFLCTNGATCLKHSFILKSFNTCRVGDELFL